MENVVVMLISLLFSLQRKNKFYENRNLCVLVIVLIISVLVKKTLTHMLLKINIS